MKPSHSWKELTDLPAVPPLPSLKLCVILEPMQELMSRHKTYSLSPRDCLKTCLFQKWQRMVAPPGNAHIQGYFLYKKKGGFVAVSLVPQISSFLSVPAAEPARQAPNKRRKRKVSGGSTVSSGGANNNNSNSKKKSPGNSFSLSSQVPVSISSTPSICTS